MSFLAVCTSFGEEYSVLQTRMTDRKDVSEGRDVRSCRGLFQDIPIELVLMGIGSSGVHKFLKLDWSQYLGVLHLGYCGGLVQEIKVGDLVFPERVLSEIEASIEFELPPVLLQAPWGIHRGELLTVNKIVRTQFNKMALHEKTGAVAVDMEAFDLAKGAREKGVSLCVLKAVADSVSDNLPEFGPQASPDLIRRWKENMAVARQSLSIAAEQLVPGLYQIWSF